MEELEAPIITNKTTSEFTLPIFLNNTTIDDTLFLAPLTLKEYVNQYKHDLEIFDLKERHDIEEIEKENANKNFFNSQVVKIFKFVVAIILIVATVVKIYAICKHNKLRALVTSLALQQVREVKAEDIENENHKCEYIAQFYIIFAFSIVIICLIIFAILRVRRVKICRGQLLSNVVKIMLFISEVQYYVPVKLCKTAGSIHLFKITGKITTDKVKLNKHYIWDILKIDWNKVKVTFNGKVTNLPKSITVTLWDKFKIREMMGSQPVLFHLMLKQGFNWFTLTLERQEIDKA